MENENQNLAIDKTIEAKKIEAKQIAKKEKKVVAPEIKKENKINSYQNLLSELNKHNISKNGMGSTSREKIYRFQLSGEINSIEAKKMRNKLRSLTISHCMNVKNSFISNGEKINEIVKADCKKFVEFYKSQFILNDFSISSLCSGNRNEADKKIMQSALEIVKKSISK